MKQIAILGATGSIGLNTLEVLGLNTERFSLFALTAHKNVKKMTFDQNLTKSMQSVFRKATVCVIDFVLIFIHDIHYRSYVHVLICTCKQSFILVLVYVVVLD